MSLDEDDDPLGANSPPPPPYAAASSPLPPPRLPLPLPPPVRPPSIVRIQYFALFFLMKQLTLVAAAERTNSAWAGPRRRRSPASFEFASACSPTSAASAHSAACAAASYNCRCCSRLATTAAPQPTPPFAQRPPSHSYCSCCLIIRHAAEGRSA